MIAQLSSYSNLSEFQKSTKAVDPEQDTKKLELTQDSMKKFSRFAVEELLRRNLKRNAKPLTKTDILQLLSPDFESIVLKYKADLKSSIDKKLDGESEDKYAIYKEMADQLRENANKQDFCVEEKIEDCVTKKSLQDEIELSQDAIISKCIESLPWMQALNEKKSKAHKLIAETSYNFRKWQGALIQMLGNI